MTRPLASLIVLLPALLPLAVQGEGYWDGRLWMADFSTPAMLATDGEGRLIMAGGSFSVFNPQTNASVGSWNGHRWTPIHPQRPVAVAGQAGNTWLAGQPAADSITQVNPAGELIVLPSVEGTVLTLTVDDTGLLAGGQFVAGSGNTATNVARWNGTDWVPLGMGLPGKVVKLSATEGGLLAGLDGTLEQPATVWRWDGTAWTQLGPIPGDSQRIRQITDLVWHAGGVVAAINSFGVSTNPAVLSWSGNQWQPYGLPTLTGNATSLAIFQGELYVGGSAFIVEGFTGPTSGVQRLVGGQWQNVTVAPGLRLTSTMALTATRNELFVLCNFQSTLGLTTGLSTRALWQFDGHDGWLHGSGLSVSIFEEVSDLKTVPAGVVLSVVRGGSTITGRYGFLWDGAYLKPLALYPIEPGATFGLGRRMIRTASQVYRQASRSPTTPMGKNLLARLEDTNWVVATAPMTLSMGKTSPMAADGETIYVSGQDDAADGNPVAVARWRDSWERLGGYFTNGTLQALAVLEGQPVAGGSFKTIGGQPVTNLARWDGITWQPVTPAPDGPISAFARWGKDLVVVGSFTNIGGIAARGVALWTSTGWQSLSDGLGLAAPVAVDVREDGTLAVSGGIGSGTSEIWLRRGTVWEPIGRTFVDGTVNALAWQGHDLFVGGGFYGMGEVESGHFAIWHEASPQLTVRRLPDATNQLHRTGSRAGTSILERGPSPDQLTSWMTNSPLSLRQDFPVLPAVGSGQEFYRIRIAE